MLRELKTLEAGSELFKQALAELSRAQGVVLGNVGVYVDASVDSATLTHSRAALAKALVRQGLVAEAMRGGGDGLPLLRGITAQTLAGVAAEEQVIMFAERAWCLRQLARTLAERHGVEAHVADGQVKPSEFEALKRAFGSGEFPVLCLSRIGAEGHNLQNASVIVRVDLRWLPSGLEQRVGRAARPGGRTRLGADLHPYIRGAGIEHIVSILSPGGAEHHAVLDSFEGVAASQSTVATLAPTPDLLAGSASIRSSANTLTVARMRMEAFASSAASLSRWTKPNSGRRAPDAATCIRTRGVLGGADVQRTSLRQPRSTSYGAGAATGRSGFSFGLGAGGSGSSQVAAPAATLRSEARG